MAPISRPYRSKMRTVPRPEGKAIAFPVADQIGFLPGHQRPVGTRLDLQHTRRPPEATADRRRGLLNVREPRPVGRPLRVPAIDGVCSKIASQIDDCKAMDLPHRVPPHRRPQRLTVRRWWHAQRAYRILERDP